MLRILKFSLLIFFISLCIAKAQEQNFSINANGLKHYLAINPEDNISLEVNFPSNIQDADWWVAIASPWGEWFFHDGQQWKSAGWDVFNIKPYAYPQPGSINILNASNIPEGDYIAFLAKDSRHNGQLDLDALDYVSLKISVKKINNRLTGLNFSPYIEENEDPNYGTNQLSLEELEYRLSIIAPYTKWIKTYGCNDDLREIGRLAHAMGLKTAIGAWISNNREENQRQIECLIQLANEGFVDIAVVGSEVLYRNDLPEQELVQYIQQVKEQVPDNVYVTTADTYDKIINAPLVQEAVDVFFINIFPYWEGKSIDEAIGYLIQRYIEMLEIDSNKKVYISETGWPSQGEAQGQAEASLQNAISYFRSFTHWAHRNNIPYFYFEAFDEPWKRKYGPEAEAHFGIWQNNGQIKPGIETILQEDRPFLELVQIPPIGSTENLKGRVSGVNPSAYKIVVYIYVPEAGWWIKPYAGTPITTIAEDGSWECDITTGGHDTSATEIRVYLIPAGWEPPIILGRSSLPEELELHALDSIHIRR